MRQKEESPVLVFTPSKRPLTLGVEIEIQLLDKDTLDLSPVSPKILERLGGETARIKAEIFQSMLELNTGICQSAHEVRLDLSKTMDQVTEVCDALGIRLASAGTHPFALYSERILYPAVRYQDLIDRNQWIARRLMIFGLHIHIGMRDGDHAVQMNNALLHYLPILLALSASSPFWHGEDTELASSRITFFEAMPTGGHPCRVMTWADFSTMYEKLVRSQSIRSPKDIWWDIRPSPGYGTIEIRICDGLPSLEETAALTALVHALCILIDSQLQARRTFAPPPDWIMRENKWRASRWGVDSKLIVDEDGNVRDMRELTRELMITLSPIAAEQKYESEFLLVEKLLSKGASYQRQRVVAKESKGDLRKVADFLTCEFSARRPLWRVAPSTF